MRLADDVYLLCHDDRSGQLQVAPRVAVLGLAAALLGELVLSEHLSVYRGGIYPMAAGAPRDRLAREVLSVISDGRQSRELGDWLRFLAVEALVDVRRRLVADEVLLRVRSRRLIGGPRWEYPPVNSNTAAWPGFRLAGMLSSGETPTAQDAVLVGLVQVLGLLPRVLWDGDQHGPGWAQAERVRRGLPAALSELVAHTEAVVGDAVLTQTS